MNIGTIDGPQRRRERPKIFTGDDEPAVVTRDRSPIIAPRDDFADRLVELIQSHQS
jgi:hypothetical protein